MSEPNTSDATTDESKPDAALVADIEQAVGDISDAREEREPEAENTSSVDESQPGSADDAESGEAPQEDSESDDQEDGDSDDSGDGLSDSALERAVKAGFSIREAKQFPNDDLLNAACDRIEGVRGDSSSQGGAGEVPSDKTEAEPGSVEELLSAIPKLSKDEYDEGIVDAFEGMREINKRLLAELRELRGGRSQDWLSTQLDGVKKFTQGDPAKIEGVREKFDVLKAGYKAAGKDVSDEAVFSEAANLVLSAEMKAAERQKKAQAARRRENQRIQRTTGRRVEAKADAHAEAADLVNQRIRSLA